MVDLEALEPTNLRNDKRLFREWIYEKAERYVNNNYPKESKTEKLSIFDNFVEGAFTVWEMFIHDEL